MAVNPISQRFPFELRNQPPEVVQAHRYAFQGIVDLNQAILSLKTQLDGKSSITTTVTSSGGGGGVTPAAPFPFPGLGGVNDQTGATTYTIVAHDNGIFLIFSDASPVAVTLDSSLSGPYFFFGSNYGAGVVTLTPTSGTINGAGSWVMQEGGLFIVTFDGTNWRTSDILTLPQTITHTVNEWLDSYDASTSLFTASQPDFTNISGNLATSQLPTAGISTTIVTAQLTTLGTQGSMTFVNGQLTASVPAT